MSNSFYEDTMLKEEFGLVVRLQQEVEFSKYVNVSYEDRITGEARPVTFHPSGPRYPEKYIIEYRMPVYVSPGQLRRDWQGTAMILLSEPVLTNKHSRHGPHVTFHSNFEPFNNHVRRDSICSGNAWAVARDHGTWHFIISLGALINQDEFVSADGGHMNGEAYDYWLARDRKPVTNIAWPLDLLSVGFSVRPVEPENHQSSTLKIIPKATGEQTPAFNITRVPDRLDIKSVPAPSAPAPIVITPKKG
jgi:hypothetical protein